MDSKSVTDDLSPTEQALELDRILNENLNKFCPEKTMKLGSHDKLFVTARLKQLDRQTSTKFVHSCVS